MKKVAAPNSSKLKPLPVVQTKIEEEFSPPYLYPVEMIDSPDAWGNENFYFGQAPAVAPDKPWYEKLVDIYGLVRGQKEADKLRKENIARMRRGQPVMSVDDWRAITPPSASVEFGLTPQIRNILIFGAIGLGAVFLLSQRKRA